MARRADRSVGAVGVLVRPHPRLVVAADVLQRHHCRHLRAARRERAGGDARRRRVDPRRTGGGGSGTRRLARAALTAGRDAGGHRGRHARAPRLRVAGLRDAGSRWRAGRLCRRRAGPAAGRPRRRRLGRRGPPRGDRDPPGTDGGRHRPARRDALGPARRARLRAAARRRRRPDRSRADARRDRGRAAHAFRAGRSADRLRRAPARPAAALERTRLPGRQHRPGRAARRRALRRRRLQDELAGASRGGPDRLAPPPGRTQRRDDAFALRAAGAALHRRAASLPALAAAGLFRFPQPRRGPVPLRAGDDGPGDARCGRRTVRRVHLAASTGTGRGAERCPRPRGGRVTDIVERFDARLARGASGLLLEFNDAGVLAAADVHVARRLAGLAGGADDAIVLAAALAVRAPRIGHVFVDLERIHETATVDVDEPIDLAELPWPWPAGWVAQVEASGLAGPDRPLRLEGSALYLDRYWREEQQVAADLDALAGAADGAVRMDVLADGIARLFAGDAPDVRQKQAAAAAVLRRLAVVAGGPGTGKTTTVARIVALLEEQALATGAAPPLVALAAPTGKAAARLAEAVHGEAARLAVDPAIRARLLELEASTLHRLLGWKPGTPSRFRHDRGNRLPYDVVIVDETSMVSLSLMARLTEAVRREARLILVGDPGQLTSIEAGAVLGDIVGPAAEHPRMSPAVRAAVEEATGSAVEGTAPPSDVPVGDGIVVLRTVHRFGGGIERLADAIHAGDADAAVAALADEGITWIDADAGDPAALDLMSPVRDGAVRPGLEGIEAPAAGAARRARPGRPHGSRGDRSRRGGRRRARDPRARRVPRPLRPPPRAPRRRHLDAAHRDVVGGRAPRLQRRTVVRGPPAARHRE